MTIIIVIVYLINIKNIIRKRNFQTFGILLDYSQLKRKLKQKMNEIIVCLITMNENLMFFK